MTTDESLLRRVAFVHVALLAAAAVAIHRLGGRLDGLAFGGGLAAFSYFTFWVMARTLVQPDRKALAYVLGSAKVLLYLGLTAAVLSGKVVTDAAGFAVGVTCFVTAVIGTALAWPAPQPHGSV